MSFTIFTPPMALQLTESLLTDCWPHVHLCIPRYDDRPAIFRVTSGQQVESPNRSISGSVLLLQMSSYLNSSRFLDGTDPIPCPKIITSIASFNVLGFTNMNIFIKVALKHRWEHFRPKNYIFNQRINRHFFPLKQV